YIGEHAVRAPGLRSTLAISCWSGLLAGYAELASFQVRVQWAQGGLLRRSPHVYWMMPLSNMILFALIGVCIEVLVWWIPRWTATILAVSLSSLGFLAVLLTLPGLKAVASLMLAIGLGSWIGPALVARSARFAQVVKWTLPAMIVVMLLMACLIVSVRTAQRSQWDYGWVSPVSGSPNVLLIVLDTVRHDATSLDGEGRDTTPFLRSLASRGASFSQAIAPTSWTLTSHASMFTARWPWELGTGPDRPLDARYPTLAEWMSSRGYRTAGIVANTVFCSEEYGLSRGFQHYEDYIITPVEVVRASSIGWLFTSRLWKLQAWLGSGMGFQTRAPQTEETHRKTAGEINEAALNWIGQSRDRPFFLYLNYLDAHDPYILPAGAPWSFGPPPASLSQWNTLADWDSQITQARNR
ncbi:MAG TPA: sulfatase-like hydrolase/transferase, partial [Isosphaeraceae bacterium]|nr:sulfatase-like hydrolase/transferase [Isosphaeraceae bacterium]